MANPIRPEDIIDEQGVVQSLKNVQENLRLLKEAMKGKAKDIKITINGGGDMSGFIAQINALTEAMGKLNEFSKVNADYLKTYTAAQREANRATRSRKSASDDYYETLRKLNKEERELEKIREATENTEKLLSGEVKATALSYNQLSAVYSEMSSRLKNLNKEQIEGSAEMKRYAATTKMVRDAMNEAQKAMGNYSLNVGRYHTAFDGLGYSIQQVMREVPSAVNISQFFLAISNNIPMVVDQMKLFNEEQANIKKQLGELQEGTKEYMELQQKQMSLGQKVLKSIFSWQTALLGVLLLLRKLPEMLKGLGDKIENFFLRSSQYLMSLKQVNAGAASTVGELRAKYEGLRKEFAELADDNRADWVKRHADDWKDLGIKVGDVKTAEDVYVNNTSTILKAIDKRARAIAAMNLAAKKYEEAFSIRSKAELDKAAGMSSVGSGIVRAITSAGTSEGSGVLSPEQIEQQRRMEQEQIESLFQKRIKEAEKIEKEARFYIENWWSDDSYNAGGGSGSKKEPTLNEIKSRYWDRQKAYIDVLEDGFEKETALAKVAHGQAMDENKATYEEQLRLLEENKANNLITEEEYEKTRSELKKDYDAINLSNDAAYEKQSHEIWEKYEKMRIEAEIADSDVVMKQTKRRVKLREDEIRNNAIVMENIARLMAEKERLEAIDTKGIEEEEKKKQEAIDKTTAAIERQRNALSWEKQLANYKNIGDMLGSGDWLSGLAGGDKRDFLTALGLNMEGASDEQVDSAFDVWEKNATEAMVKWKDVTIDSLGQMLDAYVEFYEAKAEAASEDTDRAREEYELQKSLLDQGYANSVNTAWAEYQQKQQIQKQAEADAKRAQKTQKLADEAQNMSNLILATTNILKQYAVNPILAGSMIAAMWGTYGAAKVMALSASKYEHGGYEELTGGSHASGHDINLGIRNGKGRTMIAEGGESIAIFSRNAKRRYGSENIAALVKSVNDGTFERSTMDRLGDNVGAVRMYGTSVNLSKIESGIGELVSSAKSNTYTDARGNLVVVSGNSRTTIVGR